MTEEGKKKIIRYMVAGGATAAAIGAAVRSFRSSRARERARDAGRSKDAIVVPVIRSRFMEGLPSPGELAASRGEALPAPSAASGKAAPPLPAPAAAALPAPAADGAAMSPEEIEARKREIVRSNARRIDFLGKRASSGSGGAAPAGVEKSAQFVDGLIRGVVGMVTSPIDSAKQIWNSATGAPLAITAGTLGSLYIAAKLTDAINERRRERSMERLEDSRERYVKLLGEAGEKRAQADARDVAGWALGGAFLFPAAMTALITNRILENRRDEKRRQKKDSYPWQPVILYKTSEAREVEVTPESVLAVLLVKRAMAMDAGRMDAGRMDANPSTSPVEPDPGGKSGSLPFSEYPEEAKRNFIDLGARFVPDMPMGKAVDTAVGMMTSDDNSQHMLDYIKGTVEGDSAAKDAALFSMGKGLPVEQSLQMYKLMRNPGNKAELVKRIQSDRRMQDMLVDRFTGDKYRDTYGAYGTELVNNELASTFRRGSFLYNIVSWLVNNLGIGRYMMRRRIAEMFPGGSQSANAAAAHPQANA